MRNRWLPVGVLLTVGAGTADAQSGVAARCTAQQVEVQDVCQKAVDLFNYMAPQLGAAIAGGNATLGQASVLGGLGHFSLGLRVNAVLGAVPDFDDNTTDDISAAGAMRSRIATMDAPIPMPVVDAAIGLFEGFPVGLTHVGGIDALVSAFYVPKYDDESVTLDTPDGSLKFGYGARLGLLREAGAVPAVSLTYLVRELPSLSLTGVVDEENAASAGLQDFKLKTTSTRIVIGKHLGFLGIALGAGQDTYETTAQVLAQLGAAQASPFGFAQKITRTNIFADVNFKIIQLEIGQVSGGDAIGTYNTFEPTKAGESYTYGSVGFRIGF